MSIGLLGAGCPRKLEEPQAMGQACESNADCNAPSLRCGALRVCVRNRCEQTPSLYIPCR
ncbi:MAG: hypothetical protein RMJ84_04365 [Sandaracinaceae bacterium]|nr:hypothetical protein [Sandaracinaceae bacterium]